MKSIVSKMGVTEAEANRLIKKTDKYRAVITGIIPERIGQILQIMICL